MATGRVGGSKKRKMGGAAGGGGRQAKVGRGGKNCLGWVGAVMNTVLHHQQQPIRGTTPGNGVVLGVG